MIDFKMIKSSRIWEMIRFYQAAILNTIFGLSIYSILVYFGMNVFVSQIISHIMGSAFNYLTYSLYVFRETEPRKLIFIASYLGNYIIGVSILFFVRLFVENPYLSGLMTALLASVLNYFILKFFVFKGSPS